MVARANVRFGSEADATAHHRFSPLGAMSRSPLLKVARATAAGQATLPQLDGVCRRIGFFRRDLSEARNYWFLVPQPVIVNVEIWIEDGLALRAEEGRLRLDPFARLLLFRISHQTCL